MAEMLIQSESLTSIADKIRVLKGITEPMSLYDMETELDIIPKNDSTNLTVSGATVTVPAGYYDTQATKSVTTATQATPSISINSSGLITASATQTAGYVAAGTKSGTKQLTTKAATTITPSTSNQTIASGTYLTGTQTIAGDADLKAENIKKGVNIFGVAGSYESVELNFEVVGGTTEPKNPTSNTIWVNTSTTISSWVFSPTQPTNPSSGMVWIFTDSSSDVGFNALKNNGIQVYPVSVKQYVRNTWVDKTAKTYQNGRWVEWNYILYLYQEGNKIATFTEFGEGTEHWVSWNTNNVCLYVKTSAGRGDAYQYISSTGDVSNYSELIVKYAEAGGSSTRETTLVVGLSTGDPAITLNNDYGNQYYTIPNAIASDIQPLTETPQSGELVVDISSISGAQTVFVALVNNSSGFNGKKESGALITEIALQ